LQMLRMELGRNYFKGFRDRDGKKTNDRAGSASFSTLRKLAVSLKWNDFDRILRN
jgi:hypothetical protein